jgi:ABC-2 type transport system ATP-binding protein
VNDAPAILAVGLVKRYPVIGRFRDVLRHPFRRETKTALAGVDIRVDRGRCSCLLGPNGAGKTTLIKILATLVLPDEGQAFVGGHDVEKAATAAKREVGYAINDERSFYWRLTGRQNLEFFGALEGLRGPELRAKIDEALAVTNLQAAAGQRFNTYSTGMRQMLSFARSLLTDADILFVDEPTRSLDPKAAARIRLFLRKEMVEKAGKTVFWATHNLYEAAEVGDDVAIIDHGRIRRQGTVSGLTDGGRLTLQQVYEAAVPDVGEDGAGAGEAANGDERRRR